MMHYSLMTLMVNDNDIEQAAALAPLSNMIKKHPQVLDAPGDGERFY